ncbi:MAG: hypothetical protein Q8O42_10425 [Acidobacteriota bacterium]|nr:hypothetical protein [Acidobacteriota bacterium]
MNIQALTVAALLLVLIPRGAAGQAPDPAGPGLDRFSLQAAAGPLLQSGGYNLSAAFGFSPLSRLDLLVSVERTLVPFERTTFSDGYSLTRGGTLTAVSGEVRVSFLPPHRVSPYAFAGLGGGVSRPTVNNEFPTEVKNDLLVVYFGGGVRVPMRGGFSIFGDARAMMALEGDEGIMGLWPVRAGVAWRF